MAKKRSINKSQEIRDYLAKNPTATPKVIKADLAKRGIKVTDSLVSLVKYKTGTKRKKTRRGGVGRGASANISADELLHAKEIADRMGGVDRAKAALGMLERLR